MESVGWFWIRPAIAIAPPEGISSVVSAWWVLIAGMVSELVVTDETDCERVIEFSFDSSETSVITRIEMWFLFITTGVKLSEMPNFLKLICVVQTWVVGLLVLPAGTGNSLFVLLVVVLLVL